MTSNKKSDSNAMLNPTDSTVNIANTTYVVQDIEETFKKIANNTTDNNYTEVTTQDQNNLKLNSNGNNNTEQKKNKNTEKQRKTTENKNINENRNKKKMNRWGNTNKYAGDKLNENDGTTLRILYNNCNSLEINNLIHEKMKFKFEKKKTQIHWTNETKFKNRNNTRQRKKNTSKYNMPCRDMCCMGTPSNSKHIQVNITPI